MKIFTKTLFFLFLTNNFLVSNLSAQILDSSFYGWTIYEIEAENEDQEKKCYMINSPIKSDSNHNFRDKPYIMITRYQNRRIEEFSINSGFEYRKHSKIFVAVDDEKFSLSTNNDMAWMKSKKEDVMIIQKILNSTNLKVRADSAIETYSIDEYSLKGVAKAYNRLKTICN